VAKLDLDDHGEHRHPALDGQHHDRVGPVLTGRDLGQVGRGEGRAGELG
jgi:hypothetical protein